MGRCAVQKAVSVRKPRKDAEQLIVCQPAIENWPTNLKFLEFVTRQLENSSNKISDCVF